MKSTEQLRRDAKALRKAYEAGHTHALQRVANYLPRTKGDLRHADFLHVVAREKSFERWPSRTERDYLACLELALKAGVALPRRVPELAGDPDVAAFLADWAEAHPGQVVEGGVA